MYLQGQDGLAELTVDDLANSGVNGAQAADDAFDAGDDAQNVAAGEFLNGQNKEQNGQGQEYSLGSSVVLEGADEHKQSEDAPQKHIEAHGVSVGSGNAGCSKGIDPDENQRPPESAVGGESGAAESVAVLELKDAGNDLSKAAQGDAHGNDYDGEIQHAAVMQVKQNGGHAETHQAKRAGIGSFYAGGRHFKFLPSSYLCNKHADYTEITQKLQHFLFLRQIANNKVIRFLRFTYVKRRIIMKFELV